MEHPPHKIIACIMYQQQKTPFIMSDDDEDDLVTFEEEAALLYTVKADDDNDGDHSSVETLDREPDKKRSGAILQLTDYEDSDVNVTTAVAKRPKTQIETAETADNNNVPPTDTGTTTLNSMTLPLPTPISAMTGFPGATAVFGTTMIPGMIPPATAPQQQTGAIMGTYYPQPLLQFQQQQNPIGIIQSQQAQLGMMAATGQPILNNPAFIASLLQQQTLLNPYHQTTAPTTTTTATTALLNPFLPTLNYPVRNLPFPPASPTQPYQPGVTLSLYCDAEQLSEYQFLLRQQLEYFEATTADAECSTQGRKRAIVKGQVGVRCRHCASLPLSARGRGAVYYPKQCDGIYQAAQNMSKSHLISTCRRIPPVIQQQLTLLRSERTNATGGKKYWTDGAQAIGIYETERGLRWDKKKPENNQNDVPKLDETHDKPEASRQIEPS